MFLLSCAAAGQFAHWQSLRHMHLSGCIKYMLALWLPVSAGVEGVIGQRSGFLKDGRDNVETGTLSAHRQLEKLMKAMEAWGYSVPVFLCVVFVANFLCT